MDRRRTTAWTPAPSSVASSLRLLRPEVMWSLLLLGWQKSSCLVSFELKFAVEGERVLTDLGLGLTAFRHSNTTAHIVG